MRILPALAQIVGSNYTLIWENTSPIGSLITRSAIVSLPVADLLTSTS